MSLQEQLRERAEAIREQQRAAEPANSERERYFRESIALPLRDAARYFTAVVRDIETIQPEVTLECDFGLGTDGARTFRQQDYRVTVDDDMWPHSVAVACRCVPIAETGWRLESAEEAATLEGELRERAMPYGQAVDLTHSFDTNCWNFSIQGAMPAGFRLQADVPKRRIVVQVYNLEDRPVRRYSLRPERVEEALFESLCGLLLREQGQLFPADAAENYRWYERVDVVAPGRGAGTASEAGSPWATGPQEKNGASRASRGRADPTGIASPLALARSVVERGKGYFRSREE